MIRLILVMILAISCGQKSGDTIGKVYSSKMALSGSALPTPTLQAIQVPYNQETNVDLNYVAGPGATCSINNVKGNLSIYSSQIPAMVQAAHLIVDNGKAVLASEVYFKGIVSQITFLDLPVLEKGELMKKLTAVKTLADLLRPIIISKYNNYLPSFDKDVQNFMNFDQAVKNNCDCLNGKCSANVGLYGNPNNVLLTNPSFDYIINDGGNVISSTTIVTRLPVSTDIASNSIAQYVQMIFPHTGDALGGVYNLYVYPNNVIQAPKNGVLIGCNPSTDICQYQPFSGLAFFPGSPAQFGKYGFFGIRFSHANILLSANAPGLNDLTFEIKPVTGLPLKYAEPFFNVEGNRIIFYSKLNMKNTDFKNILLSDPIANQLLHISLMVNQNQYFFSDLKAPLSLSSPRSETFDTMIYEANDPVTLLPTKYYIDIYIN